MRPHRYITERDLLRGLRHCIADAGRSPTSREYDRDRLGIEGFAHRKTISTRLDGWRTAVTRAHFVEEIAAEVDKAALQHFVERIHRG